VKEKGIKTIRRWGLERGWLKPRPSTWNRRVHQHGVPRSKGRLW
jgi:hypothetical protein